MFRAKVVADVIQSIFHPTTFSFCSIILNRKNNTYLSNLGRVEAVPAVQSRIKNIYFLKEDLRPFLLR